MTQVLRMINGVDNKHHDYDYTQALVRLSMDKGGVGFLTKVAGTEFDLDIANQVIKPGVAFILCTRATSSPISNQEFLSVFYSDADVPVIVGPNRKYWIEVDQVKIDNPLLIDDINGNDFLLGKGIAEIKSGANRPASGAYLKLWSTDGSTNKVDERNRFMIEGNNVDMSDLKKDIVSDSDVYGDMASFFFGNFGNLTAVGTVSLPIGSVFGGQTIQNLVNSYVASNLLTEFSATNAEAWAGTVTNRFVNPFQMFEAYSMVVTPGTTFLAGESLSNAGSNTNARVLTKSMTVKGSATYRTFFEINNPSNNVREARIYKNGIAFGTTRSSASVGTSGFTQDLAFVDGDTVEVWTKSTSSNGSSVQNFTVKFDMVPKKNKFTNIT